MYEIIKSVINSGSYELANMLKKIDTVWVQGEVTEEQRTELIGMAQEKAKPENSYAPLQEQIDTAFKQIASLEQRVKALEGDEEEPEEYPTWVQPTGAHDAYNTGDKMTYTDGKKYVCKVDNCVWGPDVYPDGWDEVK